MKRHPKPGDLAAFLRAHASNIKDAEAALDRAGLRDGPATAPASPDPGDPTGAAPVRVLGLAGEVDGKADKET